MPSRFVRVGCSKGYAGITTDGSRASSEQPGTVSSDDEGRDQRDDGDHEARRERAGEVEAPCR